MAVDRVGEEDATEKENFLNQEDPHAERGGFLLLVQRLVLPKQLSGAMHSVLLQQVAVVAAPPIDRSKDRPLHRPEQMAAQGAATGYKNSIVAVRGRKLSRHFRLR